MSNRSAHPFNLAPRQDALLRLVGERGFGTVENLARHFGVSTQTIRRDIIALTAMGLLQRFHGGAGPAGAVRLGHAEKLGRQPDAKARIGTTVVREVPLGASVFLDVGTTIEAIAAALAERRDLRVFTNNMVAALRLAGADGPQVRILGGVLRGSDGSLVGGETVRELGGIAPDIALIACSGFDARGAPTDFDGEKIAVKRAAIAAARRSLLVADSTKFSRHALERIAPIDAFAALVTDTPPDGALLARLRQADVPVIAASTAAAQR
jgi:DeoR family glycerol-3-phosphate regulon repressor